MSAFVTYVAVYRSVDNTPNSEGHDYICVGLFGDLDDAITEAKTILADGHHLMVDHGVMPQGEWDALEEVADDFVPTSAEAAQ